MNKAAIEIAAPPSKIFEYLTEPKHVKTWQPDVVETRPLPPGGLQVGAHVGETVQEYGRRFDIDVLVASIKRNEHIAYRTEAPAASTYVEYQIVPWGPKTLVVSTGAMRPKGFLGSVYPLVQGLIKRTMQRKMTARLMLLRAAVESHA